MRHKSFFMSEGVAVFKVPMHSPPPSCFPVVTLGSRSCTIRPSRWTRSCGSCWRRSRRRGRSRRSQCRQRSGDSHAGECPAIAMCPNICSIPPQCAHIRHIHVRHTSFSVIGPVLPASPITRSLFTGLGFVLLLELPCRRAWRPWALLIGLVDSRTHILPKSPVTPV